MHVVISGGTGYLGEALAAALGREGHRVSVLTRRARPGHPGDIAWDATGDAGPWASQLEGADAIVNLAGAGIADKRWTAGRKALLLESRVRATTSLVKAAAGLAAPPRVFLSGSGVGIYGPCGDERVSEATPAGDDFMARLAARWELAAEPAARVSRLAFLRTAPVLGREGVLAKMLPPFKLGVGGRLGSGRQWMPWIHVGDWVALTMHLLTDDRASGPVNLTAPEPVTNAGFTKALGRALGRPTVLPVPAFALKLALGELSSVLLTGQRAVPERARELGYEFRYPTVDDALAAALGP